jgi:hypothetical protein
VLKHCRRFATLDAHAAAWGRTVGAGDDHVREVRSQLAALVDAGLLVSRGEVLAAGRSSAQVARPPAISTIGVVTCDRPELLGRNVASYMENARAHDRVTRFVVVDDSPGRPTREEVRERLRAAATRYDVRAFYAGAEEKRRFAAALSREAGAPADVVEFALFDPERCGFSVGANLNALLFQTIGELFFLTSDDTECRVAPAPQSRREVTCTSRPDPTEFRFFEDRDASLRSLTFVDADLLGLHEQLLGRDLPSCIAASDGEPRLDRIGARFVRRLSAGRGRVVATMNGLVGDSGMGSTAAYLLLRGASHRRLIASEAAYRSACASRAVVRAVSRPTISDGSFCMSGFLGLDQRATLPPFFPVRRNSDGILGVTLRRSVEDGLFGLLPWVLVHNPPEPRRAAADDIWHARSRPLLYDIVIASLLSCRFGAGETSTESRLRALGRHLTALGSLAAADYEEVLRLYRSRQLSALMTSLEERLRVYGEAFAPWVKDVTKSLETLQATLSDAEAIVPVDLIGDRGAARALALSQRLIYRYGRLLDAWPELISAARRLRDRGESPAVPCS